MSTLLADTIRKTGGTAGVDIRIKNNSVYESDGGTSVTQNIVQGLAKVWSRFNGSSFAGVDSFNQASLVDGGTGIYQVNMTNPYSANEGAHGGFSGAYHAINRSSGSASQIELGTYNSSHSSVDESRCFVTSHGDLA
tara:strand:- start:738 stop:1148 length:411 start_codon:yes stop_codon:yes gene_type:complete